jgi:uncharacterized ion transporter superfamily protein YfcC
VVQPERGERRGVLITPTNGALFAVLLTANVTWGRWVRFAIPGALLVSLVGLAGIVLSR